MVVVVGVVVGVVSLVLSGGHETSGRQEVTRCKNKLGDAYPRIFLILGNDDFRREEQQLIQAAGLDVFDYIHNRREDFKTYSVYGYSHVPPTPFQLKDWERYDVSRYVDPGSVSPERGARSIPIDASRARYGTIKDDLERLTGGQDLTRAVLVFHTPPYKTKLS